MHNLKRLLYFARLFVMNLLQVHIPPWLMNFLCDGKFINKINLIYKPFFVYWSFILHIYKSIQSNQFIIHFQANTIVLIMVIRKVMNSHKVRQQENIEKVKKGVRATIVILPILGLTWVFGLIAVNEETVFFRYLFAIFNSAQGLLIFLFHCVLNKKVTLKISAQLVMRL